MADRWSYDEEHTLKTRFGIAGREELLRLLPARTYRGIKEKALSLGLLYPPTKDEVRSRVEAGHSLRQIGREFDLDGKTIHRYCRLYGIALRSQPEATSLANRNTPPAALLRPPLDPRQSWLLGVIATDGNLSDRGRLRVSSVDEDIVRNCKDVAACGSLHVEHAGKRHPMFVWSYTARGLSERLAPLGIEPRKTFTLRFPNPSDLHLPSFVRGLWDGDGYWRTDSRGWLAGGFGCSSKAFIEALWACLRPELSSRAHVYKHPSKEHWVIRVDRQRARHLASWMYQPPCEVYCERKKAVACPNCGSSTGCG